MSKNPLINALSASIYIILVAMIMFYGPKYVGPVNSVIAPIALVSLFTLSAAVMGLIFLFQPAQMYLDGKKKTAINLFVQTLISFAFLTIFFLILLFTGVFK